MTPGGKTLVAVVVGLVLVLCSAVGLTAAAVYRAGSVHVDVADDEGSRVSVRVPVGLTEVALAVVPDAALAEASRELHPYLPAIHAVHEQLSGLPDFTLVEAWSREGHLLVRKVGRRLVVEVESTSDRVRVSVPLRLVGSVVRRLESHSDRG